ncbi:hypothetical protein C8R43DRAFT_1128772 [Mycena crocata]|nr:hypothetical protein C8R43DRAFT_1128772 [Mycena crocata]
MHKIGKFSLKTFGIYVIPFIEILAGITQVAWTCVVLHSFPTFLVLPDTFWFFLGLAPSTKLYMNSMLATLNACQRIRNKIDAGDKGWNSIGNSIHPPNRE